MLAIQQQPIHKAAQNVIVPVLVTVAVHQHQVIAVAHQVHQVTAQVVQVPLIQQHPYLHQHVVGAAAANAYGSICCFSAAEAYLKITNTAFEVCRTNASR